jgi:hypothetical protein
MEKIKESPFKQASKDILDYLNNEGISSYCGNQEVWIVLPTVMLSKYTRSLNNKLGLHKINKHGERMSRYKNNN